MFSVKSAMACSLDVQKAIPDEVNFLDRENVQMLVGEDQLKYERA